MAREAKASAALRDLGYDDAAVKRMLVAASSGSQGSSAPLAGVTVVDLTRVLAGPLCTHILSELGARVIKVESRDKAPSLQDGAVMVEGDLLRGSPGFFAAVNHSKECISLDLRAEEDRQVFEGLLAAADVLVENFRPGILGEKLGYSWESLHARFPSLIYCSVSGYGHAGPDARLPAMDVVVQARSGLMSVTGHEGTPPTGLGVQLADMAGGMWAVMGVQAALLQRLQTGEGVRVDISMLDCCVAMLTPLLPRVGRGLPQPDRRGAASQHSAPFNVFECADGEWIAVVGLQQHFWEAICHTLGVPKLIQDPRFESNGQRLKNRLDLEAVLQTAFRGRPQREWMHLLLAKNVPCAPVNKLRDVLQDTQLAARNMIVTTADGHVVPGNPVKMSNLSDSSSRPKSPAVDSHGDAIRAEFQRHSRL
mmetsp:Transcript_99325/g.289858  ORF Transcript_99325/g.289858 Transcript_99325/m.289858 type:complete len:423 (-) Transcript_99325:106-1374(-)